MPSYTWEDEQAFKTLSWKWAKAYDLKEWDLLKTICAPSFKQLYSQLQPGLKDTTSTPEEYAAHFAARTELGDERLHTQHHLGAVVFEMTDADNAVGNWQIFVVHLRTLSDGKTAEWSCGSYVEHFYQRINGEWKFSGIKPSKMLVNYGQFRDVIGHFD